MAGQFGSLGSDTRGNVGIRRDFGNRTDDDGHFETTVPLPSDLTTGPATIEVASSNGVIASAVVTIDPDRPAPAGFAESDGAVHPEPVGFDPVPLVALLTLGMAGVLLAVTARGRRTTR